MTGSCPLPDNLRIGRRALEGASGICLLDDFAWDDASRRWVLHAEIAAEVPEPSPIAKSTEWFVLVAEAYPWGEIGFYPSVLNCFADTYPHQNANDGGGSGQRWRNGKLCLDTTVRVLGRTGPNQEPFDSESRLLWHFRRAQEWLSVASRGELVLPGEPFELPIFPGAAGRSALVAFSEGQSSHGIWEKVESRVGMVDLVQIGGGPDTFLAKRYALLDDRTVFSPAWGTTFGSDDGKAVTGIWILLPALPIQPPWQAPASWGDLSAAVAEYAVDIMKLIGEAARYIRDGQRHIALIGFPIAENATDSPRQIHWQPILLPRLSTGEDYSKGFRPNEMGYWERDRRQLLAGDAPVDWLESENWDALEVSRRGRLPEELTEAKILLLGGGALGSVIGELLVRGGVRNLAILDNDVIKAGNLVRHTLTLRDVGQAKSLALANHLNLASPHASVVGIEEGFPPSSGEPLAEVLKSQIIVDCTASDDVHHQMHEFDWIEPKLFASIWFGMNAKRLYCFTAHGIRFPHQILRELVNPWLQKEADELGNDLPREGIGCWHPVFPATGDDVWLIASVATKHLATVAQSESMSPQLDVYEQEDSAKEFVGLRKIATVRG